MLTPRQIGRLCIVALVATLVAVFFAPSAHSTDLSPGCRSALRALQADPNSPALQKHVQEQCQDQRTYTPPVQPVPQNWQTPDLSSHNHQNTFYRVGAAGVSFATPWGNNVLRLSLCPAGFHGTDGGLISATTSVWDLNKSESGAVEPQFKAQWLLEVNPHSYSWNRGDPAVPFTVFTYWERCHR